MDQPTAASWSHCLEHAALSDVGLQRANNQDSFAVTLADNQDDFERRGHLFVVADGMGAHAAGELASKMATDIISLVYRKRLDRLPMEAILAAIINANHQIHNRGQASPDFHGMGTTATALLLLPSGALLAHVGDSRAYRWRNDRIEQLTFDHSLVWEMRAAGDFPNCELPGYISKNIITRSLGPHLAVKVDMEGPHPLHEGDIFLLCCDGLSNQVKDDEIGLILGCLPPAEAVHALVDLANLRGGPDNITVVIAKLLGPQISQNTQSRDALPNSSAMAPTIHPAIWMVIGVSVLAAIGLFLLGYPLRALLSVLCAGAGGVIALMRRYAGMLRKARLESRRFGRGPYVSSACPPSPELLGRLTEALQQLKDTATKENWSVEWDAFEAFLSRASAATQAGNLLDAARESLHALMFASDQHRRRRGAPKRDNGVIRL